MTPSDLKTGDLIFFINSLHFIEHIALFANHKEGIPYIIHAITAPYYSVMLTALRPADISCSYLVMRPKQTELSLIATGILYRWVELQVPFATTEKRDTIVQTLEERGGFDCPNAGRIQEPFGKKSYLEHFPQYLEMANALPFVPSKEGKPEGMFCSETIIAAFNVGAVISKLSAIEQMGKKFWTLDAYDSVSHFVEQLDNPLPFDAKATLPAGIYEHCRKDPEHWEDLNTLVVDDEIVEEIARSKGVWREFKETLLLDASQKVRDCLKSPTHVDSDGGASPKASSSPREYLLFFAPIASIPRDSRSSPMRFLEKDGFGI